MKLTRSQLKKIITESFWESGVNMPVQVSGSTEFYWIARRAEEVPIGFRVPISGPISGKMELENLYEEVRKEVNPSAPSRFNCVYVCPSLNGFCREPSGSRTSIGHQGGVYRVRVTGKVFFTDAEMWTEGNFSSYRSGVEAARGYARSYWEGLSPHDATTGDMLQWTFYEALVDGDVEIVERVY